MATTEPATVLIGSFSDRARAARFIAELERAGFCKNEIGVLSRAVDSSPDTVTEDSAVAGALTGGTVEALAGAAATLIPGVGPVIAVGWLASTLGGAGRRLGGRARRCGDRPGSFRSGSAPL